MKSWKDYMLGILGALVSFFLIRFVVSFDAWTDRMISLTSAVVALEARVDSAMKLLEQKQVLKGE